MGDRSLYGSDARLASLEIADVRLRGDEATGRRFDHTFAPGRTTVVLGANRSGKTDLCRLIMGLNTSATGRVSIDGADVTAQGPRTRPVSLVYQAFVNYPNMTVAQNIASPLRARGCPTGEMQRTVGALADKLQISDYLTRFPHELSGGQQQRLAIARALAKQARVLLLDEPLVNLDFKLREALELELRDVLSASGTVVIYTSSDPRDAFAIGHEVLLLAHGNKVQAGDPLAVYCAPNSETAMELLAEPCINRLSRDGLHGALRPEHVMVIAEETAQPAGDLRFEMRVTACETSGDETFLHGIVDAQEWVVRCGGMLAVASGERIGLAARSADVVRF